MRPGTLLYGKLDLSRAIGFAICAILTLVARPLVRAEVLVTPTMNADDLEHALGGAGMTINSVTLLNGTSGQYGTYTNYTAQPITIGNGVVLSTGDVSFLGPPADPSLESPQPSYDMQTPGTAEFDAYGPGKIENFQSSNDVAVLRVDFSLDDTYQIQFDFVFGSVEFPFYTSSFTDSFLVFLGGTDAANQITFDQNGKPVQVGSSFSGLVSMADANTAFANPHGVLGLTTTSAELDRGDYTLLFEIGDVNDHVLDSAVFISNLRTGVGLEGTEPTDPEDYFDEPGDVNFDDVVDIFDVNLVSAHWGEAGPTGDANGDRMVDIFDINLISSNWGAIYDATPIPEPSTILTAVLGSVVLGLRALVRRRTVRS